MQILTPALVFVAAVAYGVEASVDFTTATAKSPMKTRAVDMETTKFRCKRLAVCAADPVAKLDVRSMGKPGENNKPKSPIIFDVSMDSVRPHAFPRASCVHSQEPVAFANDA